MFLQRNERKLWQKLAKLYDGNLKTTYQPEDVKEDQWIAHILRQKEVNNTLKKDDYNKYQRFQSLQKLN